MTVAAAVLVVAAAVEGERVKRSERGG